MIVWFMQPYISFLDTEWSLGYEHGDDGPIPVVRDHGRTPWGRLHDGNLTREQVREAYADNLRIAMDHVDVLRRNLDADRMVVTADHGNAMGEWLMYGHEPCALSPAMKRVPWVEVDVTDERTELSDEEVRNRLNALGHA